VDRYGRLVGIVMLSNEINLNYELVRAGLAWWYRRFAPNETTFMRLEAEARRASKGLWAQKKPIPPWEFRRRNIKSFRRLVYLGLPMATPITVDFDWKEQIGPMDMQKVVEDS